MTSAYNAHILMMEYGRPYRIDSRGEMALLYFTTTPLLSPHFFRRTAQGWVVDILAEVLGTRNYAGFWYTWGLLETDDGFSAAFADRYVDMGGALRVAGGDNRPLPSRAFPDIALVPAPDPADTVVHMTVDEAAGRIEAAEGWTLVLLYAARGEESDDALPALAALTSECQAAGVTVLGFSMDQPRTLHVLPRLLRQAGASFTAIHLRPWAKGQLTAAMAPLGIRVGAWWSRPILAVRSRAGTVAQIEGVEALTKGAGEIREACAGAAR